MFRLIGFLVVLVGSFGLGFYVGQQKIPDPKQAIINLSRHALDSALGMGTESTLQWRGTLVEAKARVVQAKSEVMDRNYGNAARELSRALDSLETANRERRDPELTEKVRALSAKVRDTKAQIVAGKLVARSRLDDIQTDLDALLRK